MCKHNLKVLLRWIRMFHLMAFVIAILLLFIILIGLELVFNEHSICDQNLVVGFFGILATFIVIGQYTQVAEVKNNFTREVQRLQYQTKNETMLLKDQLQSSYDTQREEFQKQKGIIDDFLKTVTNPDKSSKIEEALNNSRQIYNIKQELSQNISSLLPLSIDEAVKKHTKIQNQFIDYLLTGDHREMLIGLLRSQEYDCQTVTNSRGDQISNVRAKINKENLVFEQKKNAKVLKILDVAKINGKDFNAETIMFMLSIYKEYFLNSDNSLTTKEKAIKIITDQLLLVFNSSKNNIS